MSPAAPAASEATLTERIGVIGDVHGEDAALQAILDYLAGLGPLDAILCTGDIPAKRGVGNTARCCDLLEAAGARTIRGNHDRWYFEEASLRAAIGDDDEPISTSARIFLRGLPPTRRFTTPGGSLLLCHGIGTDDMSGVYPGGDDGMVERALEAYGLPGPYRLMIHGHTHRRMVRPLFAGAFTLINAGTLRWEEQPGFVTVDFRRGTVQFYEMTPLTNAIHTGECFALPPVLPENAISNSQESKYHA